MSENNRVSGKIHYTIYTIVACENVFLMVITEDSKPGVITGGVMVCNDFRQKISVMVNNRVSEKNTKENMEF